MHSAGLATSRFPQLRIARILATRKPPPLFPIGPDDIECVDDLEFLSFIHVDKLDFRMDLEIFCLENLNTIVRNCFTYAC